MILIVNLILLILYDEKTKTIITTSLVLKGLLNQRKHHTVINLNCESTKLFQLPTISRVKASPLTLCSFIEINSLLSSWKPQITNL